jgi:hypothetical protein
MMSDSQQMASPYTDAQLHARACITCGRTDELRSSGHVQTPNGPSEHLVWAVAACLDCQPWDTPELTTVMTADAGITWDALRIPLTRGLALHYRLCSRPEVYGHLGPVAASDRSEATYWLITRGSTADSWPSDCRLLAQGSTLVLPHRLVPAASSRWLTRPARPVHLTRAGWLAAALAHPLSEVSL